MNAPDPFAHLKELPPGCVKPLLFPGEIDVDDESLDVYVGIDSDLSHRRTPTKRSFEDLRQHATAREHLQRMPEQGESIHAVISGRYPLWSLVPAVADLIAPHTIDELLIATLSYSRKNAEELIELIDAGTVKSCGVIVSHYFHGSSKELYEPLDIGLRQRGHKMIAMRCHAKLILVRTTDGRHFVTEASANLRSCKNIETFVMSSDADLYRFHATWMRKVINQKPRK